MRWKPEGPAANELLAAVANNVACSVSVDRDHASELLARPPPVGDAIANPNAPIGVARVRVGKVAGEGATRIVQVRTRELEAQDAPEREFRFMRSHDHPRSHQWAGTICFHRSTSIHD